MSEKKKAANGGSMKKHPAPAKKKAAKATGFLMIFVAVGAFLLFVRELISKYIKLANRKLDIFRKTEVQKTVTNSIIAAVFLVIALSLYAVSFQSLRMMWGNMLAGFGSYEKAAEICVKAEKDGYNAEKITRLRRKIADGYIEDMRYDAALNILSLTPGENEKTASLIKNARMGKAEKLYADQSYEEASRLFYLLKDTQTGSDRYMDSLCALAVSEYLSGNTNRSHQIIMSVENADTRIERVAMDVTGSKEEVNKLLTSNAFNPESLIELQNNMRAVLEAKQNLITGRIAAGNRHTVGVKSDGTVIAAGDNFYGQTNVSAWTDIVSVAAGAWHTVGLKSDGTVVAAGDNTEGQTNVSGWTDIVKIAATAYDTIGLKKDGTVVTCGMHAYADLKNWTDVTDIAAGAHSVGALYGQGSMLSSHPSAQLDAGTLLADLSVCGACSAGVLYDGTLVTNLENSPEWENLVQVTASSTAIYGLTSEGAIKMHFFRPSDDPGLNVTENAVEIASSGTHTVILFENGSVFAFGLNDLGQTDVSGWNLN